MLWLFIKMQWKYAGITFIMKGYEEVQMNEQYLDNQTWACDWYYPIYCTWLIPVWLGPFNCSFISLISCLSPGELPGELGILLAQVHNGPGKQILPGKGVRFWQALKLSPSWFQSALPYASIATPFHLPSAFLPMRSSEANRCPESAGTRSQLLATCSGDQPVCSGMFHESQKMPSAT